MLFFIHFFVVSSLPLGKQYFASKFDPLNKEAEIKGFLSSHAVPLTEEMFGDLSMVTLNLAGSRDINAVTTLIDSTHPTVMCIQGCPEEILNSLDEQFKNGHYMIANSEEYSRDALTGEKIFIPIIYDARVIQVTNSGYFKTQEKHKQVYGSFVEVHDSRMDYYLPKDLRGKDISYIVINADLFSTFSDVVNAMFFNILSDISEADRDKYDVFFMGNLGVVPPDVQRVMEISYKNLLLDDFNNKKLPKTTDHTLDNNDNIQRDFILLKDISQLFVVNYARILSAFPYLNKYPVHSVVSIRGGIKEKADKEQKNKQKERRDIERTIQQRIAENYGEIAQGSIKEEDIREEVRKEFEEKREEQEEEMEEEEKEKIKAEQEKEHKEEREKDAKLKEESGSTTEESASSNKSTETSGSSENTETLGSSENTKTSGSSENTETSASSKSAESSDSSENTKTSGSSKSHNSSDASKSTESSASSKGPNSLGSSENTDSSSSSKGPNSLRSSENTKSPSSPRSKQTPSSSDSVRSSSPSRGQISNLINTTSHNGGTDATESFDTFRLKTFEPKEAQDLNKSSQENNRSSLVASSDEEASFLNETPESKSIDLSGKISNLHTNFPVSSVDFTSEEFEKEKLKKEMEDKLDKEIEKKGKSDAQNEKDGSKSQKEKEKDKAENTQKPNDLQKDGEDASKSARDKSESSTQQSLASSSSSSSASASSSQSGELSIYDLENNELEIEGGEKIKVDKATRDYINDQVDINRWKELKIKEENEKMKEVLKKTGADECQIKDVPILDDKKLQTVLKNPMIDKIVEKDTQRTAEAIRKKNQQVLKQVKEHNDQIDLKIRERNLQNARLMKDAICNAFKYKKPMEEYLVRASIEKKSSEDRIKAHEYQKAQKAREPCKVRNYTKLVECQNGMKIRIPNNSQVSSIKIPQNSDPNNLVCRKNCTNVSQGTSSRPQYGAGGFNTTNYLPNEPAESRKIQYTTMTQPLSGVQYQAQNPQMVIYSSNNMVDTKPIERQPIKQVKSKVEGSFSLSNQNSKPISNNSSITCDCADAKCICDACQVCRERNIKIRNDTKHTQNPITINKPEQPRNLNFEPSLPLTNVSKIQKMNATTDTAQERTNHMIPVSGKNDCEYKPSAQNIQQKTPQSPTPPPYQVHSNQISQNSISGSSTFVPQYSIQQPPPTCVPPTRSYSINSQVYTHNPATKSSPLLITPSNYSGSTSIYNSSLSPSIVCTTIPAATPTQSSTYLSAQYSAQNQSNQPPTIVNTPVVSPTTYYPHNYQKQTVSKPAQNSNIPVNTVGSGLHLNFWAPLDQFTCEKAEEFVKQAERELQQTKKQIYSAKTDNSHDTQISVAQSAKKPLDCVKTEQGSFIPNAPGNPKMMVSDLLK